MVLYQKFRSAFHGFNREDVVDYISRVNHEHESQVNRLNNEMTLLRQELEELRERNVALSAALETQEIKARELRTEEELELYRRAERAERLAAERVRKVCDRTAGILEGACAQAGEAVVQAAQLEQQLAQLRVMLEEGTGEVETLGNPGEEA